MLPPSSG